MVTLTEKPNTLANKTINTLKNQPIVNQNREIRSKLSVILAKENTLVSSRVKVAPVTKNLKSELFFPEIGRGSIINIKI